MLPPGVKSIKSLFTKLIKGFFNYKYKKYVYHSKL